MPSHWHLLFNLFWAKWCDKAKENTEQQEEKLTKHKTHIKPHISSYILLLKCFEWWFSVSIRLWHPSIASLSDIHISTGLEYSKELVQKDYRNCRNGTSVPDNNRNDVNLIDYTTNEIHQSKIESPIPTSPSSSLFVRNKNPFLIGEMKHSDDFTQSPMKICLVVSPPTSKLLQVCWTHIICKYTKTNTNKLSSTYTKTYRHRHICTHRNTHTHNTTNNRSA